jgi:hypothetical protein
MGDWLEGYNNHYHHDYQQHIKIPILKPFQWGNKYTPLAVVSRPRKTLINHCYDSANSGCIVERGRCTQHAKMPSLTSDTYE